jgi:hypothetical protein
MCDGNHKYNPPEFHKPGQMYSVHALIKGESHPIVYAMMKRVDRASYVELFQCIKQEMLTRFGHTGNLQQATWLFDYELAAMEACAEVFHPLKIQGCAFHFAKAVNAKRDEVGLKTVCKEDSHEGTAFFLKQKI